MDNSNNSKNKLKTAKLNNSGQSEYNKKPKLIITHNPARINSLQYINKKNKGIFLYLQNPNKNNFDNCHQAFTKIITSNDIENIELTEIISQNIYAHQLLHLISINPNQVYTRDSMITFPWAPNKCIISVMREPIRRVESIIARETAKYLKLQEIIVLPPNTFLEGGDVIPLQIDNQRMLLIGYERRTTEETLYYLQKKIIPEYADSIIGIKLADWRINLDGGFVPISEKHIVCHPESILSGIHLTKTKKTQINPIFFFQKCGFEIIPVSKEASIHNQACNILCLGENKLLMYDLSPSTLRAIEKTNKFEIFTVNGKDLVKGRGGCRCMSRPIY